MKNLWYVLFPKWEDVKVFRGRWEGMTYDAMGDGIEHIRHCRCTIQYSKRLDEYRIETVGYMPKEHICYQKAVDHLTFLKKKKV